MKPLTRIAETSSPDGLSWELWERDGQFFLLHDGVQYASAFSHGSDDAMAEMAMSPITRANQPTLLFAGVGLGFPLAAAVACTQKEKASFIVAEPCPELIRWQTRYLDALHPGLWDDNRISVEKMSAVEVARRRSGSLHAIIVKSTHARYALSMGEASDFFGALKGGGLLLISLSKPDKRLEGLLRRAGFEVTTTSVPASHKGKQAKFHTIVLARRGRFVPFAQK